MQAGQPMRHDDSESEGKEPRFSGRLSGQEIASALLNDPEIQKALLDTVSWISTITREQENQKILFNTSNAILAKLSSLSVAVEDPLRHGRWLRNSIVRIVDHV